MPRKLSTEHRLELDTLYRAGATIAAWYDELASVPNVPKMSATVRDVYEARDLRGLRIVFNDLVEMTRAASATQRRDLDDRLHAAANPSLAVLDRKMLERIQRIRTRGRVTSEEQYYIVREHVEFIAGIPERADETRELVALLEAFEQRAVHKSAE